MTRDELFERLRGEINDEGSRLEFLARDLMPHIDAYVAAERERIAQEVWEDEQKCQLAILDNPTSLHLNGRLAGLQRARDIVRGES